MTSHWPVKGKGFPLNCWKSFSPHTSELKSLICREDVITKLLSPSLSFLSLVNGLDRSNFLELIEKSEKILFQLLLGGIELLEQQLFDLLDGSTVIH